MIPDFVRRGLLAAECRFHSLGMPKRECQVHDELSGADRLVHGRIDELSRWSCRLNGERLGGQRLA